MVALLSTASGFYLPGIAPHEYADGERVEIKVNQLSSTKTQMPYDYYSLPFCKPAETVSAVENLGEVLHGSVIQNSPYDIFMGKTDFKVLCRVELNPKESALLAKRNGAMHAVALVNTPGFIPLVSALGVDAVINPSQITVSSILEHVRRGKIRDVHPVVEDLGEVIEAEALPSSLLVSKSLREAKIPKGVAIGGIMRGDEVMAVRGDTVIEAGDTVAIFAARGRIPIVEKLLSVRLDFF